MPFMVNKKYKINYLSTFYQDLLEITLYISEVLMNPEAADKLVDKIEAAILERSYYPLSFGKYNSKRQHKHTYYRIHVNNYFVFYVVINDAMEVRRVIYDKRDIENFLY